MPSNLLAHHLHVLEDAGLVSRHRSEGDRRRTYLRLVPGGLDVFAGYLLLAARRVLFVCTANSARSHLAAALWRQASGVPATSAGTHPAAAIDPARSTAARRHHLPLPEARPRHVSDVREDGDLVVTVCDLAHEELGRLAALHWSVPDPVRAGDPASFDAALAELGRRHRSRRVGSRAGGLEPEGLVGRLRRLAPTGAMAAGAGDVAASAAPAAATAASMANMAG